MVRVVCVAVVSVVWVCEPWWVASAVVAVVSVHGRSSCMRGSAVLTPAMMVSGDACACVQALDLGQQPDQRQLSVGGVWAVVVDVRAICAVCVCLCVSGGMCGMHVRCTVCICVCMWVRCMCGVV